MTYIYMEVLKSLQNNIFWSAEISSKWQYSRHFFLVQRTKRQKVFLESAGSIYNSWLFPNKKCIEIRRYHSRYPPPLIFLRREAPENFLVRKSLIKNFCSRYPPLLFQKKPDNGGYLEWYLLMCQFGEIFRFWTTKYYLFTVKTLQNLPQMTFFCFESGEISVAFEPQKSPQNDRFYM